MTMVLLETNKELDFREIACANTGARQALANSTAQFPVVWPETSTAATNSTVHESTHLISLSLPQPSSMGYPQVYRHGTDARVETDRALLPKGSQTFLCRKEPPTGYWLDGSALQAHPIELTSDTGTFWFFDPANVEMVVKALNGCAVNGHVWVFAGGLTDVQVDLTIRDTRTGAVRTYRNPQRAPFQPIQDTVAFSSCP